MGVMIGTEARPVPAPLPALWTFWVDRYKSPGVFTPVGPVQATAFQASRKLSGYGSGSVTILNATSSLTHEDLLALWAWRLWAFYDGTPIWCGMPTGIRDEGRATSDITLTELPGYLNKRQWDSVEDVRYNQLEQVQIAANIAAPVADVGITITTSPGTGFPRDRTYTFLESESRAQLLTNLSEVISGPQFRTDYHLAPSGLPAATLRIAYPRVGTDTGMAVRVPGTVVTYQLTWDADNMRSRTYAVGEQPEPEGGQEQPPRPSKMVDRPQPGLPRLDEVDDWPGVILDTTLQERADANATIYAVPALALTVTESEAFPPLGTYGPGDTVHVTITAPLEPDGLDLDGILTEIDVNAANGTAAWTVAIESPPPKPRQTLIGQLAALDRLTTGMFRARVAGP